MKKDVFIKIRSTQTSPTGEADTIELTTEAIFEHNGEEIILRYQESPLTGLNGTTTVFRIQPGIIILERTGAVESVMVFVEGQRSESLYQIAEGALLLRFHARKIQVHLTNDTGWFALQYSIEIENTPMGVIDYHITVGTV